METDPDLRLESNGGAWLIAGADSAAFTTVNEYLGYLADRNYSPATVRAYGFDLLAFCRWLAAGKAAERTTTLASAREKYAERFSTTTDPKILALPRKSLDQPTNRGTRKRSP